MIIWRGWGILGFVLVVMAMGGGFALQELLGLEEESSLVPGLLLLPAGAGGWFLGRWLNVIRPAPRIEALVEAQTRHLYALARAGELCDQDGVALPPERAYQLADRVIPEHRKRIASDLRNVHTFFFIPLQYFGVLVGIGGVVLLVREIVRIL